VSPAARRRVHLVDAHVLIFRAYHSLPPMQSPDGAPTGAAYGFAGALLRLLGEPSVRLAGVCFDFDLVSFRNDLFPDYKAQRGEPPEDLEPQFAVCQEVTRALGLAAFAVEGFEADDLLATLAQHCLRRDADVEILTTDKDLSQLVREDGRVVLSDPARGTRHDAAAVRERFGVEPGRIPDYLALVGDPVDNLPGVPGIGPKGAALLLRAFGGLEDIPAEPSAWKGLGLRGVERLAGVWREHRERALRIRELATVVRDVPGLEPPLELLELRGPDPGQLDPLCERLGWDGLRRRAGAWRSGPEFATRAGSS